MFSHVDMTWLVYYEVLEPSEIGTVLENAI